MIDYSMNDFWYIFDKIDESYLGIDEHGGCFRYNDAVIIL